MASGGDRVEVRNDFVALGSLHRAAKTGNVEELENILSLFGTELIDARGKHKRTLLFIAASNGHTRVVELLVKLGSISIDTPDDLGVTPLFAAATNNHVPVIEALVRLGSKVIDTPNRFGLTPLANAVHYDHAEVI